ncbi:M48 family metallopeptidase [Intestinimonas massiliensis]|uniref:M48 family metallopeptidase n=1 Tax=Intestinimonas massiliensis (ex Afouda et al. 2020) TaxID=1673721 RepID=A0ABS9MAB8_9FIRM|nr:M48 family metallopeptidase [Intestinimonas massiliensis (ex Afouda et al. 2020)]MCG4527309.1 M48 family metallopeptidase [Intestinimonas massiliensis (ex Afouda et al. 2020)]MCQ4807036.1 M48 family metallopeptidase [Intestinimonas massiliensis (ex Afouda et al. 2020)]
MVYPPSSYRHTLDQEAFEALNHFPRFVGLCEAYIANVDEVAAKIDLLSTTIRISDKQFPKVYQLLPPICGQLDIGVPDIYYVKSKQLNAWTGGNTAPYICVTSRLVNELPLDLIASVLAHECGHIACNHYLYHSIARLLVGGIADSPLAKIPAVRKYLTPSLVRALLFWDRCSELSADRASALCDRDPDKTIDLLLRLHGYPHVDREEFLKQAIDLNAFVNDSKSNKLMELMLTQDETHPRLATRAYECYEWSRSKRFQDIVSGTYAAEPQAETMDKNEVINAELTVSASPESSDLNAINAALKKVDAELERYTNQADRVDYALAVSSGVFCGLLDSLFVGEFSLNEAGRWGNEKVERFVMLVAKRQGYGGDTLAGAVKFLEDAFPIPADKVTTQFGGGLQHHLRDFSHHPTPVGLVCSILTQFTGKVYGTDVAGVFHGVNLSDDGVALIGRSIPEKIMFGVLNWAFHLVSDMAGSSGSILKGSLGTGLPGPLVSLLKELSSTPLFQKSKRSGHRVCSVWISKLFNGTLLGQRDTNGKLIPLKFDLRMELGVARQVGQQTLPVLLNECVVRGFYLLRRLTSELICTGNVQGPDKLNWRKIAPFRNRTIDRMLTISTMTFTMADTMDAAVHAAILSAGNWVLFSGKFVTRFNYVGAGRSALAIVREVSNEKKETQLIHEKMLLSEAKTTIFLAQLQEFKVRLEEKVSDYLAEELEIFVAGFDFINTGIASGNSDIVIQGNMKIQSVLGRQPQFTNQQEFDSLMESDTPLVL